MPPPKGYSQVSPFIPNASDAPASQPKRGARFDKLNALFGGGGAALAMRPAGPGAGAMDSRMRMERLRAANSAGELEAACDALLKHFQMPSEQELLCKMLAHPDAGVGERALAELGALYHAGKMNKTMTLMDALEAFRGRCREPNATALIEALLA